MADNLNIIKSKIVSSDWDTFWQQNVIADELQKSTLVVSTPYQSGSPEEIQLQKILQACTLTPDTYHIVQLDPTQEASWHIIRDKIKAQYVIIFGIMPQQLGISAMFKLNEPNRFNDCIFVPTLSLQELEKQPEAKKGLWLNALKPVFVDKAFDNNNS